MIHSRDWHTIERTSKQPAPLMVLTYKAGMDCHYCGRSHFWVRRVTATCANCEAAYPVKRETTQ